MLRSQLQQQVAQLLQQLVRPVVLVMSWLKRSAAACGLRFLNR
jgi:hypothetical protein